MRLGIFGGSFDPPHVGHYLAAVDAAEQLQLDRLIWVPVAHQPLKAATPHSATAEQRYAMTAAAALAYPNFVVSRIEIDRAGLSYTVETVEAFAREYPEAERFLLVGDDAWSQFSRWHEPERIRSFVRIAVLARPEEATRSEQAEPPEEGGTELGRGHAMRPPERRLTTRLVDVSATEIRARVRAGRSIRGFVQDAVAEIIESEGLYRW